MLARGLTSKILAVVEILGLPVHLVLPPGEAYDNRLCSVLRNNALLPQTMLLADRGYDPDWIKDPCPSARSMGEHSAKNEIESRSASARICIAGPRAYFRSTRQRAWLTFRYK